MNPKMISAGLLLLGLACWQYLMNGFGFNAIVFGVGGAAVIIFGAMGRGGDAEHVQVAADFLTDPGGAIVDAATDRLGDWIGEATSTKQAEFDPDAALARYMADRPVQPPDVAQSGRTMPTFGRKGIGPAAN